MSFFEPTTIIESIESLRLFDVKLINVEDFIFFLFKLAIDLIVVSIVVKQIYFKVTRDSDHMFTFYIFNVLIFVIVFLLSSVKLSTGFAFGLFAIFSILRYRTAPIELKEMTYLFIVIAIAVLNALSTKKVSYAELVLANGIIIGMTYGLERIIAARTEHKKTVTYEIIEHIKPENHPLLIEELRKRTGLDIYRIEIGKVDFLKDTANVKMFYKIDSTEQR